MQGATLQPLEFIQSLQVVLLAAVSVLMDTAYSCHHFTRLAVQAAVPMVRLVLAVLVERLVLVQAAAVAVAALLAALVVEVVTDIFVLLLGSPDQFRCNAKNYLRILK
jgi:hypothetical protein